MKLSYRTHMQRNGNADSWYGTFRIFDIDTLEQATEVVDKLSEVAAEEQVGRIEVSRTKHDEGWVLRFTIKDLGDLDGGTSFIKELPALLTKATGYDTLDRYMPEKVAKKEEE